MPLTPGERTHEDTFIERHYEVRPNQAVYFRQPRGTPAERWQALAWHRAGMSQAEIARRLGMSVWTIRDWTRGMPQLEGLAR